MKVKELIEELEKCNPDATVKVNVPGKTTRSICEIKTGNPLSCAADVTIVTT